MSSGPVARARLLSKTREYLLSHGLLDLTLTDLADGIGSNRRMLLYHFSSLETLVDEAVGEMLHKGELTKGLDAILRARGGLVERVDRAWAHLSSVEQEPYMRIYFARLGLAVEDPVRYAEFLELGRTNWPGLLASVFEDEGLLRAPHLGRTVSSLWSGLQIELLRGVPRDDLGQIHHDAVGLLLTAHTRNAQIR